MHQAQLHACVLRNVFLEQQLDALDTWMQPTLIQDLKESTFLLKQRVAFNKNNLEHLKVVSGVEKRLEALKTLVRLSLVLPEQH